MKTSKTQVLALCAAALAVAAGLSIWLMYRDAARTGESSGAMEQRRVAPAITLKDPAGKERSLEEFRGKTVLVHFWAAWCPPCVEEIGHFRELARSLEGKPVGLIAVSLDPKWEDALKLLPAEGLPANLASLLDASGKSAEDYGTYQFPETYLLKPDGDKHRIAFKWVGPQEWQSAPILGRITEDKAEAAK